MTVRSDRGAPHRVIDAEGVPGEVGPTDDGTLLRVRAPGGPWLLVPEELFETEGETGALRLRCRFSDLASAPEGHALVVKQLEERPRVVRRRSRSGGVRVHVRVEERTEHVDEQIEEEHLSVERVRDDRIVEAPLSPWTEDGVLCVPVHEEEIVVARRLRVREVLRIRRDTRRAPARLEVRLKREQLELTPLPGGEEERGGG